MHQYCTLVKWIKRRVQLRNGIKFGLRMVPDGSYKSIRSLFDICQVDFISFNGRNCDWGRRLDSNADLWLVLHSTFSGLQKCIFQVSAETQTLSVLVVCNDLMMLCYFWCLASVKIKGLVFSSATLHYMFSSPILRICTIAVVHFAGRVEKKTAGSWALRHWQTKCRCPLQGICSS